MPMPPNMLQLALLLPLYGLDLLLDLQLAAKVLTSDTSIGHSPLPPLDIMTSPSLSKTPLKPIGSLPLCITPPFHSPELEMLLSQLILASLDSLNLGMKKLLTLESPKPDLPLVSC
jgi:hypothetical protein